MRLTLHQLKVFATLAKKLSVTQTAEALHMTQPAVSIQVKQLEAYYGVKLINVIGKKVYLTQAGQELAKAYQDIVVRLDSVKMVFAELQGCITGKLRIAAVSTAKYFIPHWLGQFKQAHTHIDIELNITNRQTLIERLRDNKDDLVIMSQLPEKLPIIATPILQDELVIVAAPQHDLAGNKAIPFKRLKDETFISRESGSGTRMVMEKLFSKYRTMPDIAMELGSSEAIKQAVMANIGLSLLSRMSIEQELHLKRLKILDVKGLPYKHLWYAVHLKSKQLSPLAASFLEFLNQTNRLPPSARLKKKSVEK